MANPISPKDYIDTGKTTVKGKKLESQIPSEVSRIVSQKSQPTGNGSKDELKNRIADHKPDNNIQDSFQKVHPHDLHLKTQLNEKPKRPSSLEQGSNLLNDVLEPSVEFYKALILPKMELLKATKDAKELYHAIENLFLTSLCSTNGHYLQELAWLISSLPENSLAKEITHTLFKKIKENFKDDPLCMKKFGNALMSYLINITKFEEESKISKVNIDLARGVEVPPSGDALKAISVNLTLSDIAKKFYKPVLGPLIELAYLQLWFDHFRLTQLEKKLSTKDLNPKEMKESLKYLITEEAFKKLKEIASLYHGEVGARRYDDFKKIWPSVLKDAFTGIYEAEKKLLPNAQTKNNKKEHLLLTTKGNHVKVREEEMGSVGFYGSVALFQPILREWLEDLKTNHAEEDIFDNSELLRNSLMQLLSDPNFYTTSLALHPEVKEIIASTEYKERFSALWKAKFQEKLKQVADRAQSKDEKELFFNIEQILKTYQNKHLPSREFERELSDCFTKFEMSRIANNIRSLLNEASFINLIEALPEFKFSDNKKEQVDEITFLFEALANNNPDILSKLSNQNFANKVKPFLNAWGPPLQKILRTKAAVTAATLCVRWGVFKGRISNKLQKKFKLPVAVEELPLMIEGFRALPDKGLVDLFRGFIIDQDIKELLNEKIAHDRLYNPESLLMSELKTFLFDEKLLSTHFEALNQLNNEHIKRLKPLKESWAKFIMNIADLMKSENFLTVFKKQWNDKEFKEQLKLIVNNPDVYQRYDLFTILSFFKDHKKSFNKNDKELLFDKAQTYIGMVLDTQPAAKKLMLGDSYKVPDDTPHDGYLKRWRNQVERFYVDGKVKNDQGQEVPFPLALGLINISFIDFDKIGKEGPSVILQAPSDKMVKVSQEYQEKKVTNLIKFVEEFAKNKDAQEQKELWHYVLRLALECGHEKSILHCLKQMEATGPLTAQDILKHSKFILANKKKVAAACHAMLGYLSLKMEHQAAYAQLKRFYSDSKAHLEDDTKKSQERERLLQAAIEPTLVSFKKGLKALPDSQAKSFLSWAFNPKNPLFKDFIQLTSLTKTAKLEIGLFNEIVSKELLLQILANCSDINFHFFAEVYSDHLTMGFADPKKGDQSALATMNKFNRIMIDTLNHRPSKEKLSPKELEAFSIYEQCLKPDEMKRIVEAYTKDPAAQKQIEHSFFTMLQLNIETGRALLKSREKSELYPLFQKGLEERYAAGDKLLYGYKTFKLEESLELGRQTILVAPTLAYYIDVYNRLKPNPKLKKVIEDNSLKEMLDLAALLVRLLNDIGTIPLENPEEALKKLETSLELNKGQADFLSKLKDVKEVAWSRIVKDATHGEYNISLDSLHEVPESERPQKFRSHINLLSKIYLENKKLFLEKVEILDKTLEDEVPSKVASNFVKIHEDMYRHDATTKKGDYAVI